MKNQIWDTKLYNTTGSFVTNYGNDVVKLLNPQADETILDLGCGTAKLTDNISKIANKVYGFDYSYNMIDDAREKYPHIDFQVGDAQKSLNYPNESFDAVFSNAALHWMFDSHAVVKNVNSVLKKNGRFVFEMGGKGNLSHILTTMDSLSGKYNLKDFHLENFYPSISEYTVILEQNRFEVKYAELINRPTLLAGEHGLRNWIIAFRTNILNQLAENKDKFLNDVEQLTKDRLYKDGNWYADYVRLRIVAYKV
ncbi:methyltransferase domain-containing protein [Francisellaceae bacterium CB300]